MISAKQHIFGLRQPASHKEASTARASWLNSLLTGSVIVIFVLALISLALPIVTIGIDIERSYNEGWNAYHAARVAAGEPLYTGDPARLVNYPFLSFYLIAWLKPIFGDVLMIGRGLNLVAFAMTALLTGWIIRRFDGGAIEVLFGAACVIGFQAIQAMAWIAADEPQMLAQALMLAGLLGYVSGQPRLWRLALCAGLFAAAGFIKHNLVAIPLAVSLDLVLKDRKWFLVWCACSATALAVFAGLSEALAGHGFWAEVLAPRPYHWRNVVYHARKLVIAFKWPILGCAVYLARPLPSSQRVLLRTYGASTLCSGLVLSGGYGVAENIYLDFIIFMGLTAGLALGRLRQAVLAAEPRFRNAALLSLVFALPIVTRSPYCGSAPVDLLAAFRGYQRQDEQFDEVKAMLREETGPVLCENLLLCFEAGKPLLIDPFNVNSQILAGRLDESLIIEQIAHHRFSLIELPVPIHPDPTDPFGLAPYLLNQGRFNEQTLRAIDQSYEPVFYASGAVLLAPRP